MNVDESKENKNLKNQLYYNIRKNFIKNTEKVNQSFKRMHKKYQVKSKLLSKELAEFDKLYSHVEKTLQKNLSGQLYMDTYGNETESTQALDTPKKKEKDLLSQFKQNNFGNNNDMASNNIKSGGLSRIRKSAEFKDGLVEEDDKLQKTNELKKMINKIDLNNNPNKNSYGNLNDDYINNNDNYEEFDDIYETNKLKLNLDPQNTDNIKTADKQNLNVYRGFNNTNKNVKFNFDKSLTVINERDSSCELIMETGERFSRKHSDEKKIKNSNLNKKKTNVANGNELCSEGENSLIRKKLEKTCNNICIRENKVFKINKILVNVFQTEAKSLRIEAMREAENKIKLTREGNLPNRERETNSNEKWDSNRNPQDSHSLFACLRSNTNKPTNNDKDGEVSCNCVLF